MKLPVIRDEKRDRKEEEFSWKKMIRLGFAFVWISLLWGMVGAILKLVTTQPDWQVLLISVIGGMTMWLYVYSKEIG